MSIFTLLHDPASFIIFLLAIVLAISVHEAAHAWVADKLGDSTARIMGRTSLNPLAHLDPLGSILFLLVGFGWGKPVPVDERNLRRRYDIIAVALAGPASNFLTAIILALFYRFLLFTSLQPVFAIAIIINLSLMLFNLIPLPPLDGSKILRLFVSQETYYAIERYSFLLLIFLFFVLKFGNSTLGDWLFMAVEHLFTLLTQTPFPLS
jgi:Zn-dependent protease